MAHTARLAFSSYLGPEKSLQSSTTGALPEEAVWQGPTDALARSRSSSSEEIFLDPSTTRRQHLSAVLIREAILGRVTVLRCEMAPWRDWTSLTYMYGRSLWRGTYLWTGRGPGRGWHLIYVRTSIRVALAVLRTPYVDRIYRGNPDLGWHIFTFRCWFDRAMPFAVRGG